MPFHIHHIGKIHEGPTIPSVGKGSNVEISHDNHLKLGNVTSLHKTKDVYALEKVNIYIYTLKNSCTFASVDINRKFVVTTIIGNKSNIHKVTHIMF